MTPTRPTPPPRSAGALKGEWPPCRDLPWLDLASALLRLLFASERERIYQQIRYFRAVAQIDFVGAYGFLNDLLW